VEAICDRVGILCRGRLVAVDTPLALRRQHHERKVDVIHETGERFVFDLDRPGEREELGKQVAAGRVASLRTREFDFRAAFLKLTGTEFD
jgi:ABC-2 type transport system ATP-binding protein